MAGAALIPLLTTLASAAVSAYGAYSQGQTQSKNARAQQAMAEYNAKIQEQAAGDVRRQAGLKEDAQRRKAAMILGTQRAAIAESGFDASGSMLDLVNQSSTNAELDALNIRYTGEMQAKGLLAQSQLSNYQGSIYGMNAEDAKTASYVGVGSALLGAANNMYSGRGTYKW
jgi:hypothetical protein